MAYEESYETVKQKLIIAGIEEIEKHSISDFSLRRVASSCAVSCAAPYKHFKSKEDFINQIATYIMDKWAMLYSQVYDIFSNDLKRCILEVSIAYIKFSVANPNFRTILMNKDISFDNFNPDLSIENIIYKLFSSVYENLIEENEIKKRALSVISLIYGFMFMIDKGEVSTLQEGIDMIKEIIKKEII